MKLVIAIISREDAHAVLQNLTQEGFYSTKLSTTGSFLMSGNITILVGVEQDKVEQVVGIMKKHSNSRKQMIPANTDMGMGYYPAMPVEVTVGGATIFVVDVERFEKL